MGYVQGRDRDQIMLMSLDDMVAPECMARVIDLFIEGCDLKAMGFTHTSPSWTGRSPYDPKSMAKLTVYGYHSAVRSSRKLETETYRNVEVMWLMKGLRPDHKTIAEFRRQNISPIQSLFHEFNKKCADWELFGFETIVVDGTKIKASNNKKMNYSSKKLEDRVKYLDDQIRQHLEEAENADQTEEKSSANQEKLMDLLARRDRYEGFIKHLKETGENEISLVDPDARLMGNNRGGVDTAYNVQSAVDAKHHLAAEYDVSMNPSDQNQLGNMVKKVKKRYRIQRFTVLADKGYYNGKDLTCVKRHRVRAIVARQEQSNPKGQPKDLHTDKFIYDPQSDAYTCPMGKILPAHNAKDADRRNFFSKEACADCPRRAQCASGKSPYRTVTRSRYSAIYEETDKRFRENKELNKLRQRIVEHPFGTIKFTMQGYYFLLRTRRKVCCEVALLFLGYNLKRVLKVLGFGDLIARLRARALLFLSFCRKNLLFYDRIWNIMEQVGRLTAA